MATIFSKIIAGDIPGRFVYADDTVVAFLDVSPMTDGHTLVVPREEIDNWADMPDDLVAHTFTVAKKIANAQQAAFGCERAGVMVQGFEVPHVHVHIWPTNSIADFNFRKKVGSTEAADLDVAAEKIRANL